MLGLQDCYSYLRFQNYYKRRPFTGEALLPDYIYYIMTNTSLYGMWPYADKIKAKRLAANRIGNEYVLPALCRIHGKLQDDLSLLLPFVVKANNGSGRNIICKTTSEISIPAIGDSATLWTKDNYYFAAFEKQYLRIPPVVFVERYLGGSDSPCIELKFFCVKGEVTVYTVIERSDSLCHVFTRAGDLCAHSGHSYDNLTCEIPRNAIAKMICLAECLSKCFVFVRIDLYYWENKIYFGEYTLTPQAGLLSPIYTDVFVNKLFNRCLQGSIPSLT